MPRTNLTDAFKHHAPKGNQAQRYPVLRQQGKNLAAAITRLCPEGDERDQAIMLVRQAVMMANASIACGEALASNPGTIAFNPDDFEYNSEG